MSKTKTAKLFRNGRSQAVRLPREFRLEGDEVRIRRVGEGVLLEPVHFRCLQVVRGAGPLQGQAVYVQRQLHFPVDDNYTSRRSG